MHSVFRRCVIVLISIMFPLGLLCGCRANVQQSTSSTSTYVSPYDWSGLSKSNGRLTYSENGVTRSKLGIDVSEFQGWIDWDAVAADDIDFVMIRLGNRGTSDGDLFVDDYYQYNISAAKAVGLPVGVYFFSQATTEEEAVEEADFVIEKLDGASLEYPVVFDEEVTDTDSRASKLSTAQLTACAKAFCERIAAAGYTPMIYGNQQDVARLDLSSLSAYDFWYAEYGVDEPSGQFDFVMWQYSASGKVSGIDTAVDMDIWLVS